MTLLDLPEILTVKEVANILKVTPLTVKRWGKIGKLQPIIINVRGDRRYWKKDLIEFLTIKK